MIAQEYALAYTGDLRSLTLANTYAAPGPFCSWMFALWEDMASVMVLAGVMRDVTLWAFTVPFFEDRKEELAEFEKALSELPQSVDAYLAQLNVIRTHERETQIAADFGGLIYRCRSGTTYLASKRRFLEVLPDGSVKPYMFYKPFSRQWQPDLAPEEDEG